MYAGIYHIPTWIKPLQIPNCITSSITYWRSSYLVPLNNGYETAQHTITTDHARENGQVFAAILIWQQANDTISHTIIRSYQITPQELGGGGGPGDLVAVQNCKL